MRRELLFILLSLSLMGYKAQGQITNNYKKIKPPKNLGVSVLDKAVVITLKTKTGSKPTKTKSNRGIFDLSDKGQKALIEAYAQIDKNSDKLGTHLSESLEKKEITSVSYINTDLTKIYRKLDFNITDTWVIQEPSNRISSLRITMTIPDDSKVKIKGFKDFQTKDETISLGTIENTSTRNFSLTAGVGQSSSNTSNTFDDNNNQLSSSVGGFTPSLSATLGSSNNFKENINLTRRIISKYGSSSNKQITIYMEGGIGRNLNGPLSLELELDAEELFTNEIDVVNFSREKDGKGKLSPRKLVYPLLNKNINIKTLELEWTYRKIIRKGKSNIEGKHVISYYTHTYVHPETEPILFLPKKDVDVTFYQVYSKENKIKNELFIKKNNNIVSLRFLSREESLKFIWFLEESGSNTIDSFTVVKKSKDGLNKAVPLSKIELQNLIIEKDIATAPDTFK